jgi:anti-anti-sigma factor
LKKVHQSAISNLESAIREGSAMQRPFQQVDYREQDGVFCVRLKSRQLHEEGLERFSAELSRLIDEGGCRKMVLNLGPGDLECLYSVFLAKLINVQRRLDAVGGVMALAEVSPNTLDVFRATGLERHFKFYPDEADALRALTVPPRPPDEPSRPEDHRS